MIAAELLAGEVPPPQALVDALHPLIIEAAGGLLAVRLPEGWSKRMGVTPAIILNDPEDNVWSLLLLNAGDWATGPSPMTEPDDGHRRHHQTAQQAADAVIQTYRSGVAAVTS